MSHSVMVVLQGRREEEVEEIQEKVIRILELEDDGEVIMCDHAEEDPCCSDARPDFIIFDVEMDPVDIADAKRHFRLLENDQFFILNHCDPYSWGELCARCPWVETETNEVREY